MNKFHNKGLKYTCDKTLNDFDKTDQGYYCQLCSKNLIDFRNKSIAEYEAIKNKEQDFCGIYLYEQINPKLYEVRPRTFLTGLLVLFGVSLSNKLIAQETEKVKIERINSDSNIVKALPKEKHAKDGEGDSKQLTKKEESARKSRVLGKRKLFFSKRFPFIHYRRRPELICAGKMMW